MNVKSELNESEQRFNSIRQERDKLQKENSESKEMIIKMQKTIDKLRLDQQNLEAQILRVHLKMNLRFFLEILEFILKVYQFD
jgi:septal ring factor EnvC (AmiA/AmiB activator)